jgi:hypothetical protein
MQSSKFVSCTRDEQCPQFKDMFRRLCLAEMESFRALPLPPPPPTRHKHALFLEFRPLPHVEALLRNAMHKLGPSWAHTVICGPDNVACMRQLAPPGVQIICLDGTEKMTVARYNLLLTSAAFWERMEGEHLLLHQEDSFIFRSSDMEQFLSYDYVGAPWPNHEVGNGGFSLRRRSAMVRLCRLEPPTTDAEDLHFCHLMAKHIFLAPWEVAQTFSVENEPFDQAIAGHQWWWAYPDRWADMVHEQ